jgi:clathrin heavy chain
VQVADAIMANEMFHHYDRPRIAMLCEKAGLAARALEHYENVDDMKRAMLRTELIPPEFLVKFFGTLSVENAIECLNHLLRTNMRQNLQTVVQVGATHQARSQLGSSAPPRHCCRSVGARPTAVAHAGSVETATRLAP